MSSISFLETQCARCGRQVGKEILQCSDRLAGRCVYEVNRPVSSQVYRFILKLISKGTVLLFAVFLFSVFQQEETAPGFQEVLSVLAVSTLVGAGATFIAWTIYSKDVRVLNVETGMFWIQETFFGIPTSRFLLPIPEKMQINLNHSHPLIYPSRYIANYKAKQIEKHKGAG